jgi:hypothetical protein
MFDEEDVRNVREPMLPRLIRIIFFGNGITNEEYLLRYNHYFREFGSGNKTQKEHSQKAAADRKFLLDHRKLTINMMRSVLSAMGWEIEAISVRLSDRLTGETREFSTDDTVEKLKAELERSRQIGIGGIE